MSLENDKELMWGILKADPEYLAHHYGKELLELSTRKNKAQFHCRCDELLTLVMNTVPDPVYVLAIIRCWLTQYRLPMAPQKLPSFDRFHQDFGARLHNNAEICIIPVL
jgi:hypothetical protein